MSHVFPHYKVDEQPNREPTERATSQKKRESEDKGAVAILNSVSQLGCVSQDSDALASQGTKEFRRPSKSSIHFVNLRYVTRVSGTRKDHRVDK